MFFIKNDIVEGDRPRSQFVGMFAGSYKKVAEEFFNNYELIRIASSDKVFRTPLKRKAERVCRFCGQRRPAVKYKKTAHLIPKSIGNKHLFSDFECDNCNFTFGTYESDLAGFLGIAFAFIGDPAEEKTPTLHDHKLGVTVRHGGLPTDEQNSKIEISADRPESMFKIDEEKGRLSVPFTTKAYVPFNVYRSLLKAALSFMPEKYVANYENTIDILVNSKSIDSRLLSAVPCFTHSGPGFPTPRILLFEKIDPGKAVFTHTFILQFLNYSFQLHLPYYEPDRWMFDGVQNVEFVTAPPFLDKDFVAKYGEPTFARLDLSGTESITRSQVQHFTFSKVDFNKNDLRSEKES
jgi:hypothetical protein